MHGFFLKTMNKSVKCWYWLQPFTRRMQKTYPSKTNGTWNFRIFEKATRRPLGKSPLRRSWSWRWNNWKKIWRPSRWTNFTQICGIYSENSRGLAYKEYEFTKKIHRIQTCWKNMMVLSSIADFGSTLNSNSNPFKLLPQDFTRKHPTENVSSGQRAPGYRTLYYLVMERL